MIVNRFTKLAYLIAIASIITAIKLATLFYEQIEYFYGPPKGIITNKGSIFTNQFWATVYQQNRTKLRFSTAYHPQTDGQTERINQVLKTYLRYFVADEPVIWPTLLPIAFFAIGKVINNIIRQSPFELLYGYRPDFHMFVKNNFTLKGMLTAYDRIKKLKLLKEQIKEHWRLTNERYTKNYNKKHKPISFKTGQLVALSTAKIRVKFKKLIPKFVKPFKVLGKVGNLAYRLAFFRKYVKLYNVFLI